MSWANKKQRLIDAKANQKTALIKLGRTPSDVWETYPDEVRSIEVKTTNTTGILHSAIGNGFASWENGAEDSLRSVTIKGCATLESSPTPDSPVIPSFISNGKLLVYGRNLLDTSLIPLPEDGAIENIIFSETDGNITVIPTSTSSYVRTSIKLREIAPSLRPGGVYTINVENPELLNTAYMYLTGIGAWYYGESRTISEEDLDATLHFYSNDAGVPLTIKNLRITYGEADAEYEPSVCGGHAVIPNLLAIPGTEYADSWDAVSGNGVRRIGKIVFSGEEVWTLTSPGISTGAYVHSIRNWVDLYTPAPIACSHYPSISCVDAQSFPLGVSSTAGVLTFTFGDTASHSVETWKEWLKTQAEAGTPLTVWYVLSNEETFNTEPSHLTQQNGYACVSVTGDCAIDCDISVEYLEGNGIQTVKVSEYNGSDIEIVADNPYSSMKKVILLGDPNLQSWNIRKGITIFTKTGTVGLPVSKEDADNQAGNSATDDYMILADDLGNITYGYFDSAAGSDTMLYNGVELPNIEKVRPNKETYRHAVIHPSTHNGIDTFGLIVSAEPFYIGQYYDYTVLATPKGALCAGCTFLNGEWSDWNFLTAPDYQWIMSDGEHVLWANTDIPNTNNSTMHLYASDPIPTDFLITCYNPVTTEFCAKGWKRLTYHVETGEWSELEDFTSEASTGWNYLKHIRYCSREKLYYQGVDVWPGMTISNMSTWARNQSVKNADMTIEYDSLNNENVCSIIPVPNHDAIGVPYTLKGGTTYTFEMDYYVPETLSVLNDDIVFEPCAPFFGFFPLDWIIGTVIVNMYTDGYAATALSAEAMSGYQRYSCSYTPEEDMAVSAAIGLGSLSDGIKATMYFKNITIREQ